MRPRRIILFRFDRNPLVCRSRVTLLRKLNPGVPIYGLFGGDRGYKQVAFRLGGKSVLGLDAFYWSGQRGPWNWKNGDLMAAAWHRDVGYRVAFDVAHLIEWDLLLLDSLDRVYQSIPEGAVGLTALTPLSAIEDDWIWTQRPDNRRQWKELLAYAREKWAYDQAPYACLGPGPCLPKAFLARYAAIDPPDLGNDELRLPLFAQILDFPIFDTGLRRTWYSREEDRFLNSTSVSIDPDVIMEEWAKPDGRRAFHPVRGMFEGRQ